MQNFLTIFFFMTFSMSAFAQNVTLSQMAMSEDIQNAYTLNVDATTKITKDVWKTYMKKYGKVKKNKQKEYVTAGASIASLASRPVDVFATFEKMGKENSLVHVWIKTEEGFFAEDDDSNDAAIAFVEEFQKEVLRTKVGKELKAAEKALKKKDSHLSKLIKNNERLHKNIENYKKKIQKAEEDIDKNENEQNKTKEELENQKQVVEDIKTRLSDI